MYAISTEQIEYIVDNASTEVQSTVEIVELIDQIDKIARLYYDENFISADFISDLNNYIISKSSNYSLQELENFGSYVLSNLNLILNE